MYYGKLKFSLNSWKIIKWRGNKFMYICFLPVICLGNIQSYTFVWHLWNERTLALRFKLKNHLCQFNCNEDRSVSVEFSRIGRSGKFLDYESIKTNDDACANCLHDALDAVQCNTMRRRYYKCGMQNIFTSSQMK